MAEKAQVDRWFSALCAVPWLVVASPYLAASAFWLALSRWPRPMLDDPKQFATVPFHLAFVVFQFLFLSSFLAIPLPMGLALWNHRKILSDWRSSLRFGVFAFGLLAIWLVAHYDRVWDWFLD